MIPNLANRKLYSFNFQYWEISAIAFPSLGAGVAGSVILTNFRAGIVFIINWGAKC